MRGTAAWSVPWVVAPQLLLALVLLATGVGKALDVPGFAAVVARYDALPVALLLPGVVALTMAELALSAWLVSGIRLRWAGLAAAAMHAGYAGWAGLALWRGLDIPNCGCFGVFFPRPLTAGTLAEDGALVLVSLLVAKGARR